MSCVFGKIYEIFKAAPSKLALIGNCFEFTFSGPVFSIRIRIRITILSLGFYFFNNFFSSSCKKGKEKYNLLDQIPLSELWEWRKNFYQWLWVNVCPDYLWYINIYVYSWNHWVVWCEGGEWQKGLMEEELIVVRASGVGE